MGARTKIDYVNKTWSPWVGCTPVSEGCEHCWAARLASTRLKHLPMYRGLARDGRWTGEVRVNPKGVAGSPKCRPGDVVFVCPQSDFFHSAADEWRPEAWSFMEEERPDVTFLLLTKRVDRMARFIAECGPITNVWLGVTVENQARAEERLPKLLAVNWPGKKFVSVEPMLGPVDLTDVPRTDDAYLRWRGERGVIADPAEPDDYVWTCKAPGRGLGWVIAGCESGSDARPADPDWFRSLRDQCAAAKVPYFLKQMVVDGKLVHMPALDGKVHAERPR